MAMVGGICIFGILTSSFPALLFFIQVFYLAISMVFFQFFWANPKNHIKNLPEAITTRFKLIIGTNLIHQAQFLNRV